MARLIQTEIKRVLADEILFGRLRDGGRVEIDVRDGALSFDYTPAPEAGGRAPAGAPASTGAVHDDTTSDAED